MENEQIPVWATHVEWVERNILDHEKRIREIERRIWVAAGSVGIVAAVVSFLASRVF